MPFRVVNLQGGNVIDVNYDPIVIKQNLDNLETNIYNIVQNNTDLLNKNSALNTWYQNYLVRKQADSDAAVAASALAQTKANALAKLSSDEKIALGLV